MFEKGKIFIKKNWQSICILLIFSILSSSIIHTILPPAQPLLNSTQIVSNSTVGKNLTMVALGDSLTEGIGDATESGGYVPLLAKGLTEYYQFNEVKTYNYGKSGNRTPQLITRIQNTMEIQESIASADIIVITIGGNDLMKVVKDNLFNNLTIETFENPCREYINNLTILYQLIRDYNPECPIYHLGIYNPFYYNFEEITQMQDIVNMWNVNTENFIQTQNNSYFIPINDLLYKGSQQSEPETTTNDLLADDYFHPNHTGYQIIANAFKEEIIETQERWVNKMKEESNDETTHLETEIRKSMEASIFYVNRNIARSFLPFLH